MKRRKKNLWVFGAWRGEKYSDNAKYFFEFVVQNHPEIKAVWITKSKKIKNELSKNGYSCYLYNEKSGRKSRLNAGFVFFTNGITDVGNLDLCHGAQKIALWHGMPLKKLWYATNYYQQKNFRIWVKRLTSKIYLPVQRNFSIATSENTKNFLVQSFEVRPETVWITGQPRNDLFFDLEKRSLIRRSLQVLEDEKLILYMPTWREKELKGGSFLDEILLQITEDDSFLQSLVRQKIKFLVKVHPNIKVANTSKDNLIILQDEIVEPQELLAATDLLITDYSSVFIDFALTQRPIHFFIPDLKEYKLGKIGTFLSFNELTHYYFKKLNTLKTVILKSSEFEDQGLLNTQKINTIYNDNRLKIGEYSKNLFDKITQNEILM